VTSGRGLQASTDADATRKLSGPPRGDLSLAAVLAALSDPVRLEIVCRLANGHERSCASLGLPIPKSTLTHHLKVLREAGLIVQRPVGTSRMTCLRRKDIDARFPGLLDSVLIAARKRRGRESRPQTLL
jgi:DNA-binding transcriptional ArsR family regulator